MFQFDNLMAQVGKLKRQIRAIADFFSMVSVLSLMLFYILMLCLHTGSLPKTIMYSLLTALTAGMLVVEIIILCSESRGLRKAKKKYIGKIYRWSKHIIVLASLVFSAYLVFTTDTGSLSLAAFIISAIVYLLSMFLEFIRFVGSRIANRLFVAAKMDLEGNAVGSVLKETDVLDIDRLKKGEHEDEIRKGLSEDTKDYTKDKKPSSDDDGIVKKVWRATKNYRKRAAIKAAASSPDSILAYFRKEKNPSYRLFMKNKAVSLIQSIENQISEDNFITNQLPIHALVDYLRKRSRRLNLGKNADRVSMCVTCLRIMEECPNPSDYGPFLDYAASEIGF